MDDALLSIPCDGDQARSRLRVSPTLSRTLVGLLLLDGGLFGFEMWRVSHVMEGKGLAVLVCAGLSCVTLLGCCLWVMVGGWLGRGFRFSLSVLFLAVVAVAIPCGWLTSSIRVARSQHAAVLELEKKDCHLVHFKGQKEPATFPFPPAWLTRLLGEEFFLDVVSVFNSSDSDRLSDDDLKRIGELTQLRKLMLCFGERPGESARRAFESGGELVGVTDAGLKHLQSLQHLECLSINGDKQFTASVIPILTSFPRLKALALINLPNTSEEELGSLSSLVSLELLEITVVPGFTDACMEHVKKLPGLRRLQLQGVNFGDAGILHLVDLHQLKELWLWDAGFSDAAMPAIGSLKSLQALNIHGTQITDRGVEYLTQLRQLRVLNIGSTSISDSGVAHLAKLVELRELGLDGTTISDGCLVHLQRLPHLENLTLTDTAVTEAGRERLRKHEPFASSDFDDFIAESGLDRFLYWD